MKKDKKKRLIEEAISTWGIESQIDLAIEEMAELTKALLKLRRAYNKSDDIKTKSYDNVCEEIADVRLMINQLESYFSNEIIDKYEDYKLERLDGRLEKYRKNE